MILTVQKHTKFEKNKFSNLGDQKKIHEKNKVVYILYKSDWGTFLFVYFSLYFDLLDKSVCLWHPLCFHLLYFKSSLHRQHITESICSVTEEDYDQFCLAYMFTYRDFEMGTLGLAWTGDLKNAGGVCEKNGVSHTISKPRSTV